MLADYNRLGTQRAAITTTQQSNNVFTLNGQYDVLISSAQNATGLIIRSLVAGVSSNDIFIVIYLDGVPFTTSNERYFFYTAKIPIMVASGIEVGIATYKAGPCAITWDDM